MKLELRPKFDHDLKFEPFCEEHAIRKCGLTKNDRQIFAQHETAVKAQDCLKILAEHAGHVALLKKT